MIWAWSQLTTKSWTVTATRGWGFPLHDESITSQTHIKLMIPIHQQEVPCCPAVSQLEKGLSDTVDIAEILHQVNNWIFAISTGAGFVKTINQSTRPC